MNTMPKKIKLQGIILMTHSIENKKPTLLMSKILSLLRHRYKTLSLTPSEIERFEYIYWQACKICQTQFEKYEKGKKHPEAAKKIMDDILPLIHSLRENITSEDNENISENPKVKLALCIAKTFGKMEDRAPLVQRNQTKPFDLLRFGETDSDSAKNSKSILPSNGQSYYTIAANNYCQDSSMAISGRDNGKGGWIEENEKPPSFLGLFSGVKFFYGYDPYNAKNIEEFSTSEYLKLDVQSSIDYNLCMGKWFDAMRNKKPTDAKEIVIHVDEILEARGTPKHHKGGYRKEDRLAVVQRLFRLNRIYARGEFTDPSGKSYKVTGQIALVQVAEEKGEDTQYMLLFRPVALSNYYRKNNKYFTDHPISMAKLNSGNSGKGGGKYGKGAMAYCFSEYLAWQLRIRESKNDRKYIFYINTLLKGTGIPLEKNPNLYHRFRERIESALDEMCKTSGVVTKWDYAEEDEKTQEALPGYGSFKAWHTRGRIKFTPSEAFQERARIRLEAKSTRIKGAKKYTKIAKNKENR
jgi:hypothetical protein